jgi:hypothetical protein
MILAAVPEIRIDTWVFWVAIAIPLACVVGLALWHLLATVARGLAKARRPARQSPEPSRAFPVVTAIKSAESTSGDRAERSRCARDLLALAYEAFRDGRYRDTLDHARALSATFPDLAEAAEARRLIEQIKEDPARMQRACVALTEALAEMYLDLAESWQGKGHAQEAAATLQKLISTFPETRQARTAVDRLRELGAEKPS